MKLSYIAAVAFFAIASHFMVPVVAEDSIFKSTVLSQAEDDGSAIQTVAGLLNSTGVVDVLDAQTGDITLFAPVNEVFENAQVEAILASLTPEQTVGVLLNHAAMGNVDFEETGFVNTLLPIPDAGINQVWKILDDELVQFGAPNQVVDTKNETFTLIGPLPTMGDGETTGTVRIYTVVTLVVAPTLAQVVGQSAVAEAALVKSGFNPASQIPMTVLLPTEQALGDALGESDDTEGDGLPDAETLLAVFRNHIVSGRSFAEDISGVSSVQALSGTNHPVSTSGGNVLIDGHSVVLPDIIIAEGVVHQINGFLAVEDEAVTPSPTSGTFQTASVASLVAMVSLALGALVV